MSKSIVTCVCHLQVYLALALLRWLIIVIELLLLLLLHYGLLEIGHYLLLLLLKLM